LLGRLVDRALQNAGFDPRTSSYLRFDLRRLYTRLRHHRRPISQNIPKLQLGAGRRSCKGWLNCDITASEFDIDLAVTPLPFTADQFTDIIAQQVIEHLEYDPVVLDLLRDCHRILRHGGRIWLSCPDLETMCRAYMTDRCRTIDRGLKRHWPHGSLQDFPVQHRINYYFHQGGEHRNLMDFEMLDWALRHAGFREIRRVREADLLAAYPEFPPRNDDFESLYVTAIK